MTVAYCCTRNRYEELAVAVWSLLRFHPDTHVYLFIEDDEFLQLRHPSITVINCFKYQPLIAGENFHNRWTYMALMRCAFHCILTEDKVLYLDIDTIVVDSLEELWNTDISNHCVAGVAEPRMSTSMRYFNAGVLLMNLKRIRDTGLGEECRIKVLTEPHAFPDQDCINLTYNNGEKLELPNKWNYAEKIMDHCEHPHIIHYAGIHHWMDEVEYKGAEESYYYERE